MMIRKGDVKEENHIHEWKVLKFGCRTDATILWPQDGNGKQVRHEKFVKQIMPMDSEQQNSSVFYTNFSSISVVVVILALY